MGYYDPAGIVAVTSISAATPPVVTTAANHGFTTGDVISILGFTSGDSGEQQIVNRQAHTITVIAPTTFSLDGHAFTTGGTGGDVYVRRPAIAVGGGTAAGMRFRGIAKHRGGTIIGWGYRHEDDPDRAEFLGWCKYVTPLTWLPDTTDTSAGNVALGTPGLEIIGAARSGNYSVVGKQSEIFRLGGDYASRFFTDQIGAAHGPESMMSMVSIGPAAVWISENGPAMSENGGQVQLLSTDKLRRTFERYHDLSALWGTHDAPRERVVWLMKRTLDQDFDSVQETYGQELLIWDYGRHAFYTTLAPGAAFSVGVTKGPGLALPGPSGALTSIDAATAVSQNGFTLNFTPSDTNPKVTYEFQRRLNGGSSWITIGDVAVPATSIAVTGLDPDTDYDVRGRQARNGQVSAWTTEASYQQTDAESDVPPDPTGVDVTAETGESPNVVVTVGWTPIFDEGVKAVLFAGSTAVFADADPASAEVPASDGEVNDFNLRSTEDAIYYWIRFGNDAGNSNEVAAATAPYTVTG